tara:strand:- start:1513 stop:2280 length:768 start_codon:yes stop_codon:yes gene_type:complete
MIVTTLNSTESSVLLSGYVTGHTSNVRDIWPISATTARINIPESLRLMTISSSSVNDTIAGTGARVVNISGLDFTGRLFAEIIQMDGTTGVITLNAYTSILSIEIVETGVSGSNDGVIYVGSGTVTAGVPATPYCAMRESTGVSETLSFTVPVSYEFEVERVTIIPKTIATTSFTWGIEQQTNAPFYSGTPVQQKRVLRYNAMYRDDRHAETHFKYPLLFRGGQVFAMQVSDLNSNGDIIAQVEGKLKYTGTNDT